MELVTSATTHQTYRKGAALPVFGDGFYRGFISDHEVTLRLAMADDAAAVRALACEAALVERLSHRQIVTVLDQGRDEAYQFVVFDGPCERALSEIINDVQLSTTSALSILLQVLGIVEALHANAVAWGWLRPRAFWVDGAGKLKLVNLGDAGAALSVKPLTIAEATYMAPEHCLGHAPTAASDIYACGVLAYELLAGRAPFSGSVVELTLKHVSAAPPDKAQFREGVPATLVELVHRCLAKAPEDRPTSIAVLREAITPVYAQLVHEEQARMIACPRCNAKVLPAERCPLCNAPLQLAITPPPPRRRRRVVPKMIALAIVIGIIVFGQITGEQQNSAASTPANAASMPVATQASDAVALNAPTPLPTATAVPTPQGMISAEADDVADVNIDVLRARAAVEDSAVLVGVDVSGRIYRQYNQAAYQFFLDTDADQATGDRDTPWPALGADYSVLYRSGFESGMLLRWNGTTWQSIGTAAVEIHDEQLRLRFPAAWLHNLTQMRYGVLATNPNANLADFAPGRGMQPASAAGTQ